MNDINDLIEALSIEQLKALINKAHELIEQKKSGEIEAIREQMVEMAKRVDMAPEEVLNYSSRKRRPGKPKYRNPNDPEKTWTGRGKPPRWLKDMEDPESCRIPE
ncbi:MAG: DNA-binding protein [Proteobacteria bacterium]|jgi:DNA-binding protein H-NS|nr:DNA-binding protein [Pseudomonadota bacterium]MBS1223334.1 DNA-binding protein [Pseudomonadota bacterium]MCU0806863.1 H-NS histone family protein [Candidatus Contendobacter sp.]